MVNTFHLEIITPMSTTNLGQVEYLRAPSLDGLFGVEAGHAPAIIALDVGEVKVTQNDKTSYYATSGGYAVIKREKVLLLVETIESSSNIDSERARFAEKRASERLHDSLMDKVRAKASLERAKNRLIIGTK